MFDNVNKIIIKSYKEITDPIIQTFRKYAFDDYFINYPPKHVFYPDTNLWITAFDNTTPIGIFEIHIPEDEKEQTYCNVDYSFIKENYRNKGIFKLMFLFLVEYLKQQNIKNIYISVEHGNVISHKAQLSVGFAPTYIQYKYCIDDHKLPNA